jgi:hypothetical protein
LYFSPNVIRAYGHFVENREGKILLVRTRRRQNIIKTDLSGIGWEGVDWTQLSYDRENWRVVLNSAVKIRVLRNAGNFLTTLGDNSVCRMIMLHGVSIGRVVPV